MTDLITIKNISCNFKIRKSKIHFKSYQALKDISFILKEGDILGIIGKNGAGKSTLLKLIAKILLPDSGHIIYHKPVTVSLLTLRLGFFSTLSGYDNAIIGALLLGYTKQQAVAKLPGIIAFSELGDWIYEPLFTYSSGMVARLSFAVAMEMNPDILLVDEVLGVGDGAFQEKSANLLKDKMASGQTSVLVSHNLHAIKDICNKVVWIERGVIRMKGDVAPVTAAYEEWIKSGAAGFQD